MLKRQEPTWTYLPMRKCIRTRVDLDRLLVQTRDCNPRWYPHMSGWRKVIDNTAVIEARNLQ